MLLFFPTPLALAPFPKRGVRALIAVSVDVFDLWFNMMLNHKLNRQNIGGAVKCNMNNDHLDMTEKLLKAS